MAALVTLAVAKKHLHIDTVDSDADIQVKVEQATDLVVGRCNSTAWWRAITSTWTQATVPKPVQAAILILLAHLYEHRGDDPQTDAEAWEAIDRLLKMHKDPVVA